MNKLNKLTWKYFLQQKVKEIGVVILVIFLITLFPYFLGSLLNTVAPEFVSSSEIESDVGLVILLWIVGIVLMFALGVMFAIIISITRAITKWINSNWRKARKRAYEEIRK